MITLSLDKNRIQLLESETLTSGSKNVYTCQFSFDESWEGLERTAFFQAGRIKRAVLLDEENKCQIPDEVLAISGENLHVGVRGTRGGELVLPSRMANLGYIHIGADSAEFTEPSADVYGHILDMSKEAIEVSNETQKILENLNIDEGCSFLPSGGKKGQVLVKKSANDGDADWADFTGGVSMPELGAALFYDDKGRLDVRTADTVESDNTQPITSAAVHSTVGNIEILLKTI